MSLEREICRHKNSSSKQSRRASVPEVSRIGTIDRTRASYENHKVNSAAA